MPSQNERIFSANIACSTRMMVFSLSKWTTSSVRNMAVAPTRLTLLLLAPSAIVIQEANLYPPEQRRKFVERLLIRVYGLPAVPAAQYASLLVPPPPEADSFIHRLRLVR